MSMSNREMPSHEQEKLLEQKVFEALKAKGPDDDDARELLRQWVIAEEEKIQALQGSGVCGEERADAQIDFSIRQARLYRETGLYAESYSAYSQALLQALNDHTNIERWRERCEIIENEMDALPRPGEIPAE